MPKDKVKATIYLPDAVHHRLKLRAVEERSSMTELVLRAIEELLARPAQQASAGRGREEGSGGAV
jgi:predicted transcriptional regulator